MYNRLDATSTINEEDEEGDGAQETDLFRTLQSIYEKNEDETEENFAPKYILLCIVTFCHVTSIAFSVDTVNDYAYDEIWDSDYPHLTRNTSVCATNVSSEIKDAQLDAQKKASQWSVYASLSTGIPALLSTCTLSSLSDIYGRNVFIFVALTGTFLKIGLITIAIYFKLSLNWIALFYLLEGVTGGWIVTSSVSLTYIADLTSAGKQRTFYMTTYDLVVQFGFTIGALVSGIFKQFTGFMDPLLTATGIAALGMILVLPLPDSRNEIGEKGKRYLVKMVKNMMHFFISKEEQQRSLYILYLITLILVMIPFLGKASIEQFYVVGSPFCLNSVEISVYRTSRDVLQEVFGVIMIKIFSLLL